MRTLLPVEGGDARRGEPMHACSQDPLNEGPRFHHTSVPPHLGPTTPRSHHTLIASCGPLIGTTAATAREISDTAAPGIPRSAVTSAWISSLTRIWIGSGSSHSLNRIAAECLRRYRAQPCPAMLSTNSRPARHRMLMFNTRSFRHHRHNGIVSKYAQEDDPLLT